MGCLFPFATPLAAPQITIQTPMSPPTWALLEREVLRASTAGCEEFFAKYFDERGYLLCVPRWGGDDGPDDAIENLALWPELHALGASDVIRQMYVKAIEGHIRQYTEAKTVDVPLARDGMYYKEFPVMFDWQHNAEGLRVFNAMGLSDPHDANYRRRVRRYAGFYMDEDAGAANYDPKLKLIRSLFNGSRGPLLRKATALDWTGDPIEVKNRFPSLVHGEQSYEQMLAHFKEYGDIVGDHPLNLLSTTLALNAYLATGEQKYRDWLLGYVDAWRERMAANGNIIPSNVGLDGKIGGETGGKWWGGVYGWGFSPVVPQTGARQHRNRVPWSFIGFMNAYLLTRDDKYVDAWRKQADAINANVKTENGRTLYPHMRGEQGWYDYTLEKFNAYALEAYYLTLTPEDRARVPRNEWLEFLEGHNPTFPEEALRRELERVRSRVQAIRKDETTPDTRLADDPLNLNPASVSALMQLMWGALPPDVRARALFASLRYFDPAKRRAGIPDDVAALVEQMTGEALTVTLVNHNQSASREVIVQAGGYGEHQFESVQWNGQTLPLNARDVAVRLEPGAGGKLAFKLRRFVNAPTVAFPWERK
ncbi:MAG: hypothetical protein HYR56_29415 [Acidobacteria bacterium]|nr:hypothetical protein [Acidobacteriota bacterium]MBI3421504.1 hypothetical protein [Acidobacteriota bacterium]